MTRIRKSEPGSSSRGFALIGTLLLLLAVSALAAGTMYLVMNEKKIGGSDLQDTVAYYAAEAGMEKMTADLGNLYSQSQAPTLSQIQAIGGPANAPSLPGVTYTEYPPPTVPTSGGIPVSATRNITSGPNAGLTAQIIAMSLQVTAQTAGGAQVRMLRDIEVALIPVFQFGVFSSSDLSYFPGKDFDFAGRVHTNGNLFLASSSGANLLFHDKVTAVGEVIRAELSNGVSTLTSGRTGMVKIPTISQGCDNNSGCRDLQENEGSKQGGVLSADNPIWVNISTGSNMYAGMLLNGKTGARPLQLPFVKDGTKAIEIIRRPASGESANSAVGQSRQYNLAQLRVLLADTTAEFPTECSSNSQIIPLDNAYTGSTNPYSSGVPVSVANPTYFATADKSKDSNWVTNGPLLGGFLCVLARNTSGSYVGVTKEWLELGFARGILPPESGSPNGVHPNAILILQMQTASNASVTGASAKSNWFPINLYDAREGEVRDVTNTKCAVGGVMNVVELDVGNLRNWLFGTIGSTGKQVEHSSQNGYILYFSDRRGMLPNPTSGIKTGEYGFEDNINPDDLAGAPNGFNGGPPDSAEDVNENGTLEKYGADNLGTGFGFGNGDPTLRIPTTTARKNRVSGARHALKLVNGSGGSLPTQADGSGGFTVASEQPVYVLGNYNANSSGFGGTHAAAAVIADAVTLLSNNWKDSDSFTYPTNRGSRVATQTWYRLAIAAGKNMTFSRPTWTGASDDLGTDGGVHNFLRYLEDWGGTASNYKGSLVSFFYSTYGNGIFKCCNTVYGAPTRNYSFDTDFQDPAKMPPGTPHFQDINNLGYRQDYTPQ